MISGGPPGVNPLAGMQDWIQVNFGTAGAHSKVAWNGMSRGDFLLGAAEFLGVPNSRLIHIAFDISYHFYKQYGHFVHEYESLRREVKQWLNEDGKTDRQTWLHWHGHEMHAAADVHHALAACAHGTGHEGGFYPALAVAFCHEAALLAAPEGRVEGDLNAKQLTADMVRERLPWHYLKRWLWPSE